MTKKKKNFSQEGLTRAGWLRQQLFIRPDLTLEQAQTAFDKTDLPKAERPTDMQAIYGSRNALLKRYGLENMDQIPRKPNGELVMSGLIRLYLKLYPQATCEEAIRHFALDGLVVNKAIFDYTRRHQTVTDTTSPDENQEAGPRAGANTRKKRVVKKRRTRAERVAELKDVAVTFEKMERALESLIEEAEHLGKSRLVQKLRDARRAASAAVLECIN